MYSIDFIGFFISISLPAWDDAPAFTGVMWNHGMGKMKMHPFEKKLFFRNK